MVDRERKREGIGEGKGGREGDHSALLIINTTFNTGGSPNYNAILSLYY